MTPASLLTALLAALRQPRIGVALATSCAVTGVVAGPLAYQATHVPVEQAAPPAPTAPPVTRPPAPSTSTSSTTTSSSTTTTSVPGTSTTAPRPGTTTTAGPQPVLSAAVTAAGSLVPGRRGALAVEVETAGRPATGLSVQLSATGAALAPTTNDGWGCSRSGAAVTCLRTSPLAPGTPDVLYVLADVDSATAAVRVSSSLAVPGGAPVTASSSLAVQDGGFAARFAGVLRGDVRSIGNTLLSCRDGDTANGVACAEARRRAATSGRVNNDWNMGLVDADADATTTSSSAADLTLAGEVVFAELTWSARLEAGPSGQPATGDPDQLRFATPTGGYRSITAARLERSGDAYQAVADVTDLVRTGGAGRYWAADIAAGTGTGRHGGWALVVVTRAATATPRTVLVLDGLLPVADLPAGIDVAARRPDLSAPARLGLVAYEGDWGLVGDGVTCGTEGTAISDAANPVDDVMNSTISRDGQLTGGRVPADENTFGLDIDELPLPAACLRADGAPQRYSFSTANEEYLVGLVTLSIGR